MELGRAALEGACLVGLIEENYFYQRYPLKRVSMFTRSGHSNSRGSSSCSENPSYPVGLVFLKKVSGEIGHRDKAVFIYTTLAFCDFHSRVVVYGGETLVHRRCNTVLKKMQRSYEVIEQQVDL